MILGPGSYDPIAPNWLRDGSRSSSSFASTRKQREDKASFTREIDLMHAGNIKSLHLNSLFSTAPGAGGQRWTGSPRTAPYFHARSRPYSFGQDMVATERDVGYDTFYGMESRTMADRAKSIPRTYNGTFRSKMPMRGAIGISSNELGPGSYSASEECVCGGIRAEARRGPSSFFAPTVGGKY